MSGLDYYCAACGRYVKNGQGFRGEYCSELCYIVKEDTK